MYRVGTRLWDLHPRHLFSMLLTPNRESGGQLLPPKPRRPQAKEKERRLLQRSHTLSQLILRSPVGGAAAMLLFGSRGGATGATSQKSSFLRTVVYPSARLTTRGQLNGDSYGIRTHIICLRNRPPDRQRKEPDGRDIGTRTRICAFGGKNKICTYILSHSSFEYFLISDFLEGKPQAIQRLRIALSLTPNFLPIWTNDIV